MKKIIASISGLAAAVAIIAVMEMASAALFPPTIGTDLKSPAAMKIYIESMPPSAIFMLLFGYALAAFTGGLVAAKVSQNVRQSLTVGIALTIGNVMNLYEIPNPMWLAIASTILFIPFAFAGGKTKLAFTKKEKI